MPTLENINGASLVPDFDSGLNVLLKTFGTKQSRDKEAAAEAQREEVKVLTEEAIGADKKKQTAALARLASINPDIAKGIQGALERGDEQELEQVRQETEKGVRLAATVQSQPTHEKRINAIRTMAEQAASNGEPIDRFIELANMEPERLDLELQRMKIAGTDIATLTTPSTTDNGFTLSEGQTRFGPDGKEIASVKKDPNSSPQGMASAKTEIYPNGTTIQALPDGKTVVRDPEGSVVEGPQRLTVLKEALEQKAQQKMIESGATTAGSESIKMSKEMVDRLEGTRSSIQLIDKAVELIDSGAGTGPVVSMLPTFRSASIELDNVQKQMGLNVIQNTTFGSLSKDELNFALDTTFPKNLPPDELKSYLVKKRAAQQKLANYLESAAIYLGTPGNTVAGWMKDQKEMQGSGAKLPEGMTDNGDGTYTLPDGRKVRPK